MLMQGSTHFQPMTRESNSVVSPKLRPTLSTGKVPVLGFQGHFKHSRESRGNIRIEILFNNRNKSKSNK